MSDRITEPSMAPDHGAVRQAKGDGAASLLALAERCEKAKRPDDQLDRAISVATRVWDTSHNPDTPHWLPFTYSIDAALTLVPDDHTVYLTRPNRDGTGYQSTLCYACVAPPSMGGPQYAKRRAHLSAFSKELALALCAAALRARASLSDAGVTEDSKDNSQR